jgi:hypothetical protein
LKELWVRPLPSRTAARVFRRFDTTFLCHIFFIARRATFSISCGSFFQKHPNICIFSQKILIFSRNCEKTTALSLTKSFYCVKIEYRLTLIWFFREKYYEKIAFNDFDTFLSCAFLCGLRG